MIDDRVLPHTPIQSLDDYVSRGGGAALGRARTLGPRGVIAEIEQSGLGGRGGAGFPAGRKWAAVARNRSERQAASVVVNAAEGEPGSFKDRAIIRRNPFAILEGALVAARTVGADSVLIGTKRAFAREVSILRDTLAAMEQAGWTDGIRTEVFEGPDEYLYGEETALLEVLDGRYPFPRIAPPYRRGVDEMFDRAADATSESSSASGVELAGSTDESLAAPTLASNVETFANAALIVARGAEWWRSVGTEGSPGSIVCTVSGASQRDGVGEFAMGTPLREVLETLGGGPPDGRTWRAAMSGVSNALIFSDDFDTPVSHEAMVAIGSGLGTGGFVMFDDTSDLVGLAAGVARFLAVESCGQCAACKGDGVEIWHALERVAGSEARADDLDTVRERLLTVADGARCNLATQQQVVVGSILDHAEDEVTAHANGTTAGVEPELIAAITDFDQNRVVLDTSQADKQPDWTFDAVDSGQWPADRLDDHREAQPR